VNWYNNGFLPQIWHFFLIPNRCDEFVNLLIIKQKKNSVASIPGANYTDRTTATGQRTLVPTSAERGVSYEQCGGISVF
jgi:hypothetical protein